MTSLAGAAASATVSIRGRIDLHAGGETATHVKVTKAGEPTGEIAQLGFDLHLDRFELVNYEPEYRVGYYEQVTVTDEHGTHPDWRLKASFDPDLEKHRLPNGDSFRLTGIYPDFRPTPDPVTQQVAFGTASQEWKNPAVSIEVRQGGVPKEALLQVGRPAPIFLSKTSALLFEKRNKEVKAFISHVTAKEGGRDVKSTVSVNEPLSLNGWTLYQVNYNPNDPSYSGLDAVYDPGVVWVFTGFALICLGVFVMFYVEPRLRKRAQAATPATAQAA
jgi:hypothetical protein